MALPEFPPVSDEMLQAVAERHGIAAASVSRLPQVGIFNAIYGLGEGYVLRVPRRHPRFEGTARNEAIAVPLARKSGVRTPELIAFDASHEVVPFVYSVYERIDGAVLERATPDPAQAAPAWRELGRDLAKLHCGVARLPETELAKWDDKTDPRPLPEVIARAGYFSAPEAQWLSQWLDRLAPEVDSPGEPRFLHGDSQATNLIVAPETLAYRAVIDWGSCKWDEAAHDFAGVPLRAVPAMLDGYREVAPTRSGLEARIVWRHLQIGLHQVRGQPVPDYSWAERPMGILFETLRFFAECQDPAWRALGPSAG